MVIRVGNGNGAADNNRNWLVEPIASSIIQSPSLSQTVRLTSDRSATLDPAAARQSSRTVHLTSAGSTNETINRVYPNGIPNHSKSMGEITGWKRPSSETFKLAFSLAERLDQIEDPEDRKQALIRNLSNIVDLAQPVIDHANANIQAKRKPWQGLAKIRGGVPFSTETIELSGGISEQGIYYNNALYNNIARVLVNGLQRGDLTEEEARLILKGSYDIDGTLVDKSLSPFATRLLQSLKQIHANKMSLELADQYLGMDIIMNTARLEHKIYAGLEGTVPLFTYAMHNSGPEEIAGLSMRDQEEVMYKLDMAMGNGSFVSKKDDYSHVADRTLMVYELFDHFERRSIDSSDTEHFGKPSLMDDLFKRPAEQFGNTVNEPKSLSSYVLHTRAVLNNVVYQHQKTIMRFYEDEVIKNISQKGTKEERLESFKERLESFKEKLRAHVLEGADKWKAVEEKEAQIANFKEGEVGNEETSDYQQRLEKLETEHRQLITGWTSDDGVEHEGALKYVRLIGAPPYDTDEVKQNRRESRELAKKARIPDYWKRLHQDPQSFVDLVRGGQLVGICTHFFNCRGTPNENAIKDAIENLRNHCDNDAREKVRSLNVEYLSKQGNLLNVNVDFNSYFVKGVEAYLRGIEASREKEEKENNARKEEREPIAYNHHAKGMISYLNWKLEQHLLHNYSKEELEKCSLLECDDTEIKLASDVTSQWESEWVDSRASVESNTEVKEYIKSLAAKFHDSSDQLPPGIGSKISEYIEGAIPNIDSQTFGEDFSGSIEFDLSDEKMLGLSKYSKIEQKEFEEIFVPDELFAIKGKRKYDELASQLAILRLDEKSDPTKDLGQYYFELLANESKVSAIESFKELAQRKVKTFILSCGDTGSDVPAHAAAIERGGMARIIYKIIDENDVVKEIMKQREKLFENIDKTNGIVKYREAEELYYACNDFGVYGLIKTGENSYKKVYVTKVPNEQPPGTSLLAGENGEEGIVSPPSGDGETFYTYVEDAETSKDKVFEEIMDKVISEHRIDQNHSPALMVSKWSDFVQLGTGIDFNLDEAKFKQAKTIHKRLINGSATRESLSNDELKLYDEYSHLIAEEENCHYHSIDAPSYVTFYEYTDPESNKIYYRFKGDGRLVTESGELFKGDESTLCKRSIRRDYSGIFTYEDNGHPFQKIELLDKFLVEERFLPSPSPVSGLFASKGFLKFLGLGNIQKGRINLEGFLRKLPTRFSKFMEIAGGALTLGGLIGLLSGPFGEENIGNKVGYWVSNVSRAFASTGGFLRGVLNVQKNWDIALGEAIQVASALFLQNGPKHLGLATGNIFLFGGRGIDAARRAQRVNALTEEENTNKKLNPKIVDPRKYVREIVKFSQEGIVVPCKEAFEKNGVSGAVGMLFGKLFSAVGTPLKFIVDVCKEPRLVFQWAERISEKNGTPSKLAPSGGHLLGLVGVGSAVLAGVAGIFGRMERFGEIAEHGFNGIGRWAITLATSLTAIGIFSNGKEISSNPMGIPRSYRGLDGQDKSYNPDRAGGGQQLAALGYALFPMFGLHNYWVASLYDLANGFYFGLPGAKMGVAEEESINSFQMARSILIEGQEFYKERENEDLNIGEVYKKKMEFYEYDTRKKRYRLNSEKYVQATGSVV